MVPDAAPLTLTLDSRALTPLIRAIVAETIAQAEADRRQLDSGKMAWSEEEAAPLVGLEPHQLRDERRRGRISFSRIVGRRVRYSRDDLLQYLAARRVTASCPP
jgi:hypothetical protein